ncbi:hypothetical protein J7T55_002913 [Diaporthe amygdali]|uniref:uncharacterized protein n=1 Tax=Phomopsis amygdali TaxID=1214568 RepID=UPI0022FE21BF|nr:uncharacterized protein J7T55_002913 [Diaporthe amygdali]KAJ0122400.1 hypothetical protein J7T55_002913 [Diaporthe amygdali]
MLGAIDLAQEALGTHKAAGMQVNLRVLAISRTAFAADVREKPYLSPRIVLNMGRISAAQRLEAVKQQALHLGMGAAERLRELENGSACAAGLPPNLARAWLLGFRCRVTKFGPWALIKNYWSRHHTTTAPEADQDRLCISGGNA